MHNDNPGGHDRREFLKQATMGALGGYLGLGGASAIFASPSHAGGVAFMPSQGRPFEMLVLGDSIMWGQGLKDHQKFSFHVEQWLRTRLPGVPVHRHVFAHSGARIRPNSVKDAEKPTHGEVPNHFPSICAQLDAAKNPMTFALLKNSYGEHRSGATSISIHPPLNPESVALVLLDGGINDFGSKTILNLDPTIGRAWVRRETRKHCVDRMNGLLPDVAAAFPNAKIVITNYFQIVSEQSDMKYVYELIRIWDIVGPAINWSSKKLREKFSDQSLAFHEESTAGFREAVREVTGQLLATAKPVPVGTVATSVESILQRPSRVALAEIPFGPENAYGAPQTLLFYVNEPDPAASVRKPKCQQQVPNVSPELPNCLLAAAGHPNIEGAKVYGTAISGVLERWLPEWQAAFAITTPKAGREGVVGSPASRGRP